MLSLAATFPNIQSAYIAKGMLEANGIPSVLNNEDFNAIYPIGFNSIGAIKLLVREQDLEKAQQLLQEHGDEN